MKNNINYIYLLLSFACITLIISCRPNQKKPKVDDQTPINSTSENYHYDFHGYNNDSSIKLFDKKMDQPIDDVTAKKYVDEINLFTGIDHKINGIISINDLWTFMNQYKDGADGLRIYHALITDATGKNSTAFILSPDKKVNDTKARKMILINETGTVTPITEINAKKLIKNFKDILVAKNPGKIIKTSRWHPWTEFEHFIDTNQVATNSIEIKFKFNYGYDNITPTNDFKGVTSYIHLIDQNNDPLDTNPAASYYQGRFDVGDPCPNNCGYSDQGL